MEPFHLKPSQTPTRGFTLIEMVVVTAIIVILTSIVLMGQNGFNKSILLTNTAYTLALSYRSAQSFGLSSRNFANGALAYNNTGYGIHLDVATPGSYVFFADASPAPASPINTAICPGHTVTTPGDPETRPGNCLYDGPSSVEQVQTYNLTQGYTISNFCGYVGTGASASAFCSNGGGTSLEALDITFERPNTDSVLVGILGNEYGASPSLVSTNFTTACIAITSPDGTASSYVRVTDLGQVSVSPTCGP